MVENRPSADDCPLLSRYAHVLICLSENPHLRMRSIATRLEVTERSVQKMILRLEQNGVLSRFRSGRNNRYEIDRTRPLDGRLASSPSVGDLLDLLSFQTDGTDGDRAAELRAAQPVDRLSTK